MNFIEKIIWSIRCQWISTRVWYYVLMGNKEKANEEIKKAWRMTDAYMDIYCPKN